VRRLTRQEQHDCAILWAEEILEPCGGITRDGPTLRSLVDTIATRLRSRLLLSPHVREDAFWLDAPRTSLSDDQAAAVAVGIAYGYLVPRARRRRNAAPSYYPTNRIELRLGFPIAVAKLLPLRRGATLVMRSLRQVEFPWTAE